MNLLRIILDNGPSDLLWWLGTACMLVGLVAALPSIRRMSRSHKELATWLETPIEQRVRERIPPPPSAPQPSLFVYVIFIMAALLMGMYFVAKWHHTAWDWLAGGMNLAVAFLGVLNVRRILRPTPRQDFMALLALTIVPLEDVELPPQHSMDFDLAHADIRDGGRVVGVVKGPTGNVIRTVDFQFVKRGDNGEMVR